MKNNLMRLVPAVERELREAAGRRERQRLEEQYRHAQKLEAIGRLAGGVAHDFNNLLTVITGYAELLLSDEALSETAAASIQEIRQAAERGGSLTRQLLVFSRKQKLNPRSLNLNELVVNMQKMFIRLIGEDVQLATALAPDLGMVRADAGQFEQVIMNLVVNARDAMPGGGKLTIETRNLTLPVACLDLPAASCVMLAISDTGVGMSQDVQSHIFEPFFTTKEAGKGTGLGLATAYGIIKQSGGSITVYSEPEHGTTFKICLPRTDQPVDPPAAGPAAAAPSRGTERVLVVEDDPEVRRLVFEVLRARGYLVRACSSGDEALELTRSGGDGLDLIVADVILPGLSGPEVVRRIAQEIPGLRALFISGYSDEAVLRHGMLEAGMMFLPKPFLPEALAQKVREVLDGK
jgi:nitrogen-specific signal transduction histidine kinase